MEIITSYKNQKIKDILKLQDSSIRRKNNLFIVEGFREIKLAIFAGYKIDKIIICSEIANQQTFLEIISFFKEKPTIIEINKIVFEKLAYRENKDGLIAIFEYKDIKICEIQLSINPFVIVLESLEKPGNLGAILRTADAANVDAVIVCESKTDFYNPNTIRSSIGCVFTNQIVSSTSDEIISWLKEKKIKIISAALSEKSSNCYQCDLTDSVALVFGSEANGLTNKWLSESDEIVQIPMFGKIDSMNVSVSCAILIYEAVRQRLYS